MKISVLLRYFLALFIVAGTIQAQPQQTPVQVQVTPDHADWLYEPGQAVRFDVSVLSHGHPVEGAEVTFEIGPEMMPATDSGSLSLKNGRTTLQGGTMKGSGFLRCTVRARLGERTYTGMGTAGFSPEKILPTTTDPADFDRFWSDALADARKVPLNSELTLLPEHATADVAVYHISFQNDRSGSRIYGILSVPTAPGRYPAILNVPGAGARPYGPSVDVAKRGFVVLNIGIHGVPVNLSQRFYSDLMNSAVRDYWVSGIEHRDRYAYKRIFLGAVRAVDFIFSLPQFDGERIGVWGGSQGGALSIAVAALDSRIKALSAIHPALSDHTGFLHGRAGGWPHLFSDRRYPHLDTEANIETSRYYDTVNFARRLKVPGFYTWGFNDTTCPPTSMYAAYNVITAPRELEVVEETGHWAYPDQYGMALEKLIEVITK